MKTTNGTGGVPPPEPDRADDCENCKGSGWVTQRVHVGHPNFGKATPCKCRQTDDSLSSRLDALRRFSNLGGLSRHTFTETRLDGPLSDPDARRMFSEAFLQVTDYAANPEGWLVLTGPSGSGKTHLAAAIANYCIDRQQTVFFIMVADLLDHLRAAYSPASEIAYDDLFEQVRNVPLLILDDLGAHSSTPWAQEKLFQVINHRYNNELPTVLTVRGALERLDDSFRTRLEAKERSQIVQLANFRNRLPAGLGEIYPQMLLRMTFDDFDTKGGPGATQREQKELAEALERAREYAFYPSRWLLITGTRGAGKTHLAVAISKEVIDKDRSVFFAFVPALLDHLRKTFSTGSVMGFDDLFEQVLNAPLLVLDDLGAENGTPWAEEKLYQIVVHRHEARLPTVITTSSTVADLDVSKPGIASRLNDGMVVDWVTIDAPSYRDHRASSRSTL